MKVIVSIPGEEDFTHDLIVSDSIKCTNEGQREPYLEVRLLSKDVIKIKLLEPPVNIGDKVKRYWARKYLEEIL